MSDIDTVRKLVNLWPTRAELTEDLRRAYPDLSVTVAQVHKWAEKQSIPSRYQYPVLVVGQRRGFPISADLIVRLHSGERRGAA